MASSILGIGDPHTILDQKLPEPSVTGKDRVLVLMNDYPLCVNFSPPQAFLGSLPTAQCQLANAPATNRPAGHPPALRVVHGHQPGFLPPSSISQFGEIRARHLQDAKLSSPHQVQLPALTLQHLLHSTGLASGQLTNHRPKVFSQQPLDHPGAGLHFAHLAHAVRVRKVVSCS